MQCVLQNYLPSLICHKVTKSIKKKRNQYDPQKKGYALEK